MFAELVERAHAGQLSDFEPNGRFYTKTVNGRDYWYFRGPMEQGVRRDRYVGPDSPELQASVRQHKVAKDDYKERRQLVIALDRVGIRGPDARTGKVLEALARAGVFRMRAVVVGTTAFQTYPGLLGVKLSNANTITDDLDIAQFRTISIAVDDAVDVPFLDILRGVSPEFEPIMDAFDRGSASRFAIGTSYRVDILTPNQGPDSDDLVPLPSLRTDAQALRYLDFLIYRETRSVALYGHGVPINVPAPERYALHKLIVSRLRLSTAESQAKARKDLRQAADLIRVLVELRPYELKDLWQELTERGPKWRQTAQEALALMDSETGDPSIRESFELAVR
jgi:hypothetical protein